MRLARCVALLAALTGFAAELATAKAPPADPILPVWNRLSDDQGPEAAQTWLDFGETALQESMPQIAQIATLRALLATPDRDQLTPALSLLARSSFALGDDHELGRVAHQIEQSLWPRPPDANFLVLGRLAAESKRLEQGLDLLARVQLDESAVPSARYLSGVLHAQRDEEGQAIAAWDAVPLDGWSELDLKPRALLGLARLHYEAGRYPTATRTIAKFDDKSDFISDAMHLEAWSALYQLSFGDASRLVKKLEHPSMSAHSFHPDTPLITALIRKQQCKSTDWREFAADHEANWRSTMGQIERVLDSHPETQPERNGHAWEIILGGQAEPAWETIGHDLIRDDTRLASLHRHLLAIEAERERVASAEGWPDDMVGQFDAWLLESHSRFAAFAGAHVLVGLNDRYNEIVDSIQALRDLRDGKSIHRGDHALPKPACLR